MISPVEARFKAAATSSGVPGGGAGGAFPLEAELFGVDLGAVLGAGAEAGDGTLDLGTAALLEGGAFPLEASLATGAALTLALAAAFTWGTAGAPAVALLGGAAGAGFGAAFAFALPLAGLQGAAGLPGLAADFGGALAADLGTAPSFALALGAGLGSGGAGLGFGLGSSPSFCLFRTRFLGGLFTFGSDP